MKRFCCCYHCCCFCCCWHSSIYMYWSTSIWKWLLVRSFLVVGIRTVLFICLYYSLHYSVLLDVWIDGIDGRTNGWTGSIAQSASHRCCCCCCCWILLFCKAIKININEWNQLNLTDCTREHTHCSLHQVYLFCTRTKILAFVLLYLCCF